MWTKPLPNNTLAVLLIADHYQPLPSVNLELSWLNLSGVTTRWRVRDVWAASDVGVVAADGVVSSGALGVHDCRMYLLTPAPPASAVDGA